jgi:predicted acyltransferase
MTNTNPTNQIKGRLMSLDALRGFDMFFIIAGGGKKLIHGLAKGTHIPFLEKLLVQFEHGPWVKGYGVWANGFVFYDIIMPLFLFCSGTSMPYSFTKFLERGGTKKQLYMKVLRRVAILFLLGMIKQGRLLLFDLGELRIYSNTLQAIGAGYLIAALIYLNFTIRWQVVITSGLLLLYWALLALVPVPGHGANVLTPDGNLAIYIDNIVLRSFSDGLDYTWVLSSMVFGCSVMLGAFAGQLVRMSKSDKEKVLWMLSIGAASIVVGLLWSPVFPIIKYIWTSSMVLYVGGICFILLGLFYLIIDVWGYTKWAFGFVVIGMNSITAYMGEKFFSFDHTADTLVGGLDKWVGDWSFMIHAMVVFGIYWSILYLMYRTKTFIKI